MRSAARHLSSLLIAWLTIILIISQAHPAPASASAAGVDRHPARSATSWQQQLGEAFDCLLAVFDQLQAAANDATADSGHVTSASPRPRFDEPSFAPIEASPGSSPSPSSSAASPSPSTSVTGQPTPTDPTPTADPTPTPTSPTPPGADSTGILPERPLTDVYPSRGILTIHTPGQRLIGLRIHGYVEVRAPEVTISNSAIIGPDDPADARGGRGLLKNTSGAGRNLHVEDTTIAPTWPVPGLDGVHGWDFTLDRVDISRSVDGVKVFGANVVIQHSWIHDLTTFDHDPAHDNGPSHSDGVQVQGGDNIVISGNTISGGHNSALQVTQDVAATSNLWFDDNWVDGGACTVNISRKHRSVLHGIHVSGNNFARTSWIPDCAIIYDPADSDLQPIGNVWTDTQQPVIPRRGA